MISAIELLFNPKKSIYKSLRKIIGFYPSNIAIYEIAFLHRSASIKGKNGIFINNERLEYLGDAVLDAVIAEYLFFRFPDADEGFLTQMRSKIVKREFLNELAIELGLDKYVVSHLKSENKNKNIYGDALEAFIGAVFIDKGYEKSKRFLLFNVINKYIDINKLTQIDTNYKSQLIEWAQKFKKEISFETDIDVRHPNLFISYVLIDREVVSSGMGPSKKEAEQGAAKLALNNV
jgi:ribonuclease III